jgi:hypothetical protein
VASVTEEPVCIVARREAKKLRVATSLVGVLLASAAGFFEVGAASLVLRRFRLRTSLKPSSCVVFTDSLAVVVPPAELLAFTMDLSSLSATV